MDQSCVWKVYNDFDGTIFLGSECFCFWGQTAFFGKIYRPSYGIFRHNFGSHPLVWFGLFNRFLKTSYD